DTGRGIPKAQQREIFSKFAQAKGEDREQRGGFGLGLAIVKQFVDSLGYQLTVESVEGRGTVFRLVVPLMDDPQPVRRAAPVSELRPLEDKFAGAATTLESLHELEETRILLIDDNPDI